jgi:hypothetical protein
MELLWLNFKVLKDKTSAKIFGMELLAQSWPPLVSPALIFNSDDIGFELGLYRDLRLYVPKEVKFELSQLNRGSRVTAGDTKKFRVAHVFNTIIFAADGLLLHQSACKIRDEKFSKLRIF